METESPGASLEQGCRPEAEVVDPINACKLAHAEFLDVERQMATHDGLEAPSIDLIQRWNAAMQKWKAAERVMLAATVNSQVGTPSSETLSR